MPSYHSNIFCCSILPNPELPPDEMMSPVNTGTEPFYMKLFSLDADGGDSLTSSQILFQRRSPLNFYKTITPLFFRIRIEILYTLRSAWHMVSI